VFAVEPRRIDSADEELAAVRARTGVGHGKNTFPFVGQFEILIFKLVPINRLSTGAIVIREVSLQCMFA